jgi:hypothetical protein
LIHSCELLGGAIVSQLTWRLLALSLCHMPWLALQAQHLRLVRPVIHIAQIFVMHLSKSSTQAKDPGRARLLLQQLQDSDDSPALSDTVTMRQVLHGLPAEYCTYVQTTTAVSRRLGAPGCMLDSMSLPGTLSERHSSVSSSSRWHRHGSHELLWPKSCSWQQWQQQQPGARWQ